MNKNEERMNEGWIKDEWRKIEEEWRMNEGRMKEEWRKNEGIKKNEGE